MVAGFIDFALFRRFLQKREINHAARLLEYLSIPTGDKLREKLRSMNVTGERIRFEGLALPAPTTETEDFPGKTMEKITVNDARKILSNREQGLEFAKMLDDSGSVIVFGDVVLLRPHQ
ncbi:calcium uniporter protein 1, mitochondrial-like [Nicotiana sylvestris]|uniref:calcium uniporter protein 1, mitochondrial-like n=1 Tax=Nicotiana sylvestris TaxID=4096 RepID=UPI00388C3C65